MNLFTLFAILAVIIGLSDGFHSDSLLPNFNEDRIIGGKIVTPGDINYRASIRFKPRIHADMSGASIISNRWILTHAQYESAYDLVVQVGEHKCTSVHGGQLYDVDRVINHPAFISGNDNLHNDLSLLRTIQKIQFNNFVQAIPLKRGFVGEGAAATVSGCGNQEEYLRYLEVKTVTNAACHSSHREQEQNRIYNGTLCAYSGAKGKGACGEDAGDPLASHGQLVGVFSWSRKCADGVPDGYTRISAFLPWIKEVSGVGAV